MSTLVVVRKNGVAAIGADTLTKLGYMNQRSEYLVNHSKLVEIGDTWFALAGPSVWQLVLESYFDHCEELPPLDSVPAIFEAARAMHDVLKEHYYLSASGEDDDDDDDFERTNLTALIANAGGIFGLYSPRSVQEFTRFHAFGSGYHFALGAMRAVYDREDSAEAIARIGLEAAADFDEDTGLPVEIRTVELAGRREPAGA